MSDSEGPSDTQIVDTRPDRRGNSEIAGIREAHRRGQGASEPATIAAASA